MSDSRTTLPSDLPRLVVSPMGGLRRTGPIALRPSTTIVTLVGGVDLDLTEASVPPAGARLTKVSLVGGTSLVVGAGVRVEIGGFSLIGGRKVEAADVPADAPVLRVRNWSVIGGVRVRVAG
jgi:hypothetical protein